MSAERHRFEGLEAPAPENVTGTNRIATYVSLRRFIGELQRRHVLRVTGLYLVAAWALIESSATIVPLLEWNERIPQIVVIAAIVGLPIVVLLSWFYDITPQGLQRTIDLAAESDLSPPGESDHRMAGKAAGFVGLGILVALVGFAALLPFGHEGGRKSARSTAVNTAIQSLAVLPFADLSPNRDQGYFSDGVAEELINRLSNIDGLHVSARTSSFAFKDQNLPIGDIANRLGVQAVVEGSVRREGDELRVSARLAHAVTGETLWSNTFTHKVASIFAIQDSIATSIAEALELELQGSTRSARASSSPEAYDEWLRGLQNWNRRTEQDLMQALIHFTRAIERDPDFALAHAGLAQTYAVLPSFGSFPIDSALDRGREAAARALALDPNLGEAYAALGQIAQNFQWDISSAERSYKRAIKFNANYATAHQWYGEALMMQGRYDEARRELDIALELDPLSGAALNVRAYLLLVSGDTAAFRALQAQARSNPNLALAQTNLAMAAVMVRRYDVAQSALQAALFGHRQDVEQFIAGLQNPRMRNDALAATARIARTQPPSLIALFYAALGDREKTLQTLEEGFAEGHDANYPYLIIHPLLKPFRTEPRYQKIINDLGLTVG